MSITLPTSSQRWVMRPRPAPQARLRLFCFPYAGGGASIDRPWPAGLPADIEVLAVQLPGRESRLKDAPFTRLDAMIDSLVEALDPLLTPPFLFFGHSMGALISFELARRLRAYGRPGPLHLFVSGRGAPQIPDPDPPIHQLPDPAFVERLRRLNGTPEEVFSNLDLFDLVMPLLRADFAVNETYVYTPGPPLDCPISAFGGDRDDKVTRQSLEAWQAQTSRACQLRMFSGDHFFLRSAQAELLQAVTHDLSLISRRLSAR